MSISFAPKFYTMAEEITLKSISELSGLVFKIPYQQRGYKWTEDNINILLQDFHDFIHSDKIMYCLQPITVYLEGGAYFVVDGQQRLTSLFLLQKYLIEECKTQLDTYTLDYERDEDNERNNLLTKPITQLIDTDSDHFFITRAYLTIRNAFSKQNSPYKTEESVDLLIKKKEEKSVQVIWYQLEDNKVAHQVFRDLNSGKIQLTNAELIKALLLNRTNGLKNHEQIASQFESIERGLDNDRLWFLFNNDKTLKTAKGQSRIDMLFNIVTGVAPSDYEIETRKSFFELSAHKELLKEMWDRVLDIYSRIMEFYQDVYIYHYIGFWNYYKGGGKRFSLQEMLKRSETLGKCAFRESLRKELVSLLNMDKEWFSWDALVYGNDTKTLRGVFLLHNIATILSSYDSLNDSLERHGKGTARTYEYFPFDLLHKQNWDIEHISSQTENDFTSESDRQDWLEGVQADFDFPQVAERIAKDETLEGKQAKELLALYDKLDASDKASFNRFYEKFVELYDNKIENKNGLGNLVLLDSHTNRSFHNSLFPRKRRIVIIADGGSQDSEIKERVQRVYIPVCTRNVYLKAYNKKRDVSLTNWTQDDYDAYYEDIKQKITDYFISPKNVKA